MLAYLSEKNRKWRKHNAAENSQLFRLLDLFLQGDQLYMAVYFWYPVKRDLSSLHYCIVA